LPPKGQSNVCSNGHPNQNNGICVASQGAPVRNVTVSGLFVANFPSSGVIGFNTSHLTVHHVVAVDNDEYGITSFVGTYTDFHDNEADGSGEAGLYLGDSHRSHASLSHNFIAGNQLGILLRNSGHGTVSNNFVVGNCAGILQVAGAPGNSVAWTIRNNQVLRNNKFCPPGEELPFPVTGSGIVNAGGSHDLIARNTITGNKPSDPSAPWAGGLVFVKSGRFKPSYNTVERNYLSKNKPADIRILQHGPGNRFIANQCHTSSPGGLCH
jgi:hypothetical protein